MNTKHIIALLTAGFLAACTKPNTVEFDVTATGLSEGVFMVKDAGDHTILGDNIKDGKCTVKSMIDEASFYTLDVVKPKGKLHRPFEVYIEPGKYTLTTDAAHLGKYPKIVSDSKTQQELSAYYEIDNKLSNDIEQQAFELDEKLVKGKNTLPLEAFRTLSIKLADVQDKEKTIQYDVLKQFVTEHPQSTLTAHLMAKQDYNDYPEKYLALFNQLSDAAKNSDDGKTIAKALIVSTKLQPGKKAPDIEGKTFDGKTFKQITAGKKLFLIDFWRSVNQFSRTNHETVTGIYNDLKNQGFQVISVSLDKKQLWWATAVKDDKLPWPQMSDLKGNDSPNAANWNVTTIPTYYLVDAEWKIYKKDIALTSVQLEARQYLEKHH